MAVQAAPGKLGQIVLLGMNVVTGKAGHGRPGVAPAPFQHFHLTTMNIQRGFGVGARKVDKSLERIAREVGKTRDERLAVPSMAPGAKIHLTIAGEARRIKNGGF
jgi:hypothetical protein